MLWMPLQVPGSGATPPETRISSSPAVADGVVYIGSQDHLLYALDAGTGEKLWSYQTGKIVLSSPSVANGMIFIGSHHGALLALDARTGSKRWSFTTGGAIDSSPLIADEVVYVGSQDRSIYALAALTGEKLWSYTTGRRDCLLADSCQRDALCQLTGWKRVCLCE